MSLELDNKLIQSNCSFAIPFVKQDEKRSAKGFWITGSESQGFAREKFI